VVDHADFFTFFLCCVALQGINVMSSLADISRLSPSDLEGRWEEVLHQLLVSFLLISCECDSCRIVYRSCTQR